MRTLIEHGTLLLESGEIRDGWLLIKGGVIEALGAAEERPRNVEATHIDAKGAYISPGFIDIHVHGGGGHDFMDGTEDAFVQASRLHLVHGTTALVPTTLTCSDEELYRAFDYFRCAKSVLLDNGPALLGLHLEGPYFSPEQAGAQDPAYLRNPEKSHYMPLLDAGGEDILRVSAAVELPGAMELGDELRSRGILASIGHSNATFQAVERATYHGYSHITHLYSAMSTIRREHAYRVLGVTESPYLLDSLSVELISDGSHLPPELLRLICKHISLQRICLITDAMRGAGMPDGSESMLGSLENGQKTVIRDGVAFLPDFSAFAGSVCTADRCVRTIRNATGLPMYQAVAMMSANPAKRIGVSERMGILAPNREANVLLFDKDVNIQRIFYKGKAAQF
jgi:N-acetylglucosamine-6-phosphate deacetylase